jgi:imidazolonepropionase-like amidohydrolase
MICLALASCNVEEKIQYDLVITNVGLFDGTSIRENVSIAIRNDTIVSISTSPFKSASADTIAAGGKFIIPGLVNSHVHLYKVEDLKIAIQAGIFAVIDLHKTDEDQAKLLRIYRDSTDYASFYSSGFAATVPGGHPTAFGGDIETVSASVTPEQFVANRIENGADFIKIVRDAGGGPPDFKVNPTLDFAQINEIVRVASANKKISIAHTTRLDETMKIAEMGISGFAHMWFEKESITESQLAQLKEMNVFLIPTALTQQKIWGMVADGPPGMKKYADENLSDMELVGHEIMKLHNAGILLLAGNDPPNFRINQHDDLYEELKIYSEAGLSNLEVLKTATSNPSKVFDLNGIGVVEAGKRANFILLNGDPIKDLTVLKQISGIWKNGRRIR